MTLFRERLRTRLIERHAISEDPARNLLERRHPGFSAHVGEAIPFEDHKASEDVACYVVRNPLSRVILVVPWPVRSTARGGRRLFSPDL